MKTFIEWGQPAELSVNIRDWIKFKGRSLDGERNSRDELSRLIESINMVVYSDEPIFEFDYHREVFSEILAQSVHYKHLSKDDRYALWEKRHALWERSQ